MSPELIWLDLETTGLDCNDDMAMILEVAVGRAHIDDPFNIKDTREMVFSWRRQFCTNAYVLEMHTKNGLWDACESVSRSLGMGEQTLLSWLGPVSDDRDERPILAGSSPHFDRAWLRRFMPTFEKVFQHRLYDVSSIKLFAHSIGMEKPIKAEAHRALADIIESAAHAAACARWFRAGMPKPGQSPYHDIEIG